MIAISKIEISQIFDSLQETIHSEFKSLKFSIQIFPNPKLSNPNFLLHVY